MSFPQIQTLADIDGLYAASANEPVVLFKHSTACGLSTRAERQLQKLTEPADPRVFQLVVQRARDVSDHVEAATGIRHETPQILIVFRGEVVFNASHHRVTADAVREAISESTEPATK